MSKNNRINVEFNLNNGKFKMNAPHSLLLTCGMFFLLICAGIGIILHELPPALKVVAPQGLIH